jgi:hypothetical protein
MVLVISAILTHACMNIINFSRLGPIFSLFIVIVVIVGRWTELVGPNPFNKKVVPLPFQKFSYHVENQPK